MSKERVEFKIDGMSCASCAARVEKGLNEVEEIADAKVNIATEKGVVEYEEGTISKEKISNIVKGLGYSARLDQDKTREQEEDKELLNFRLAKKRLVTSSILAGAIMALMMVNMFIIEVPFYLPIIAILGFPVIFVTGLHVHKASFNAVKSGSANMDVLVSLGSLPPYVIGLAGLFLPIQTFIEMATTIMTLHLVGKFLESRAKGRASDAIKRLLQMGAKSANILVDGKEVQVSIEELKVGDELIIRPGEKIPTDALVVEGKSLVDESMATGEPIPVQKEEGEELIGATINKQGLLKARVTKIGDDTFLSQVIKMVEECQGTKVPIQEFADRVTGYFVPAILLLTILTFVSFNIFSDFHVNIMTWGQSFLPWVNPDMDPLTLAFITATAVLVIACPCALGLGTPTAIMVGTGIGAERGILIRNGEAVQTIKSANTIAFDKTGTITEGKPSVTDITTFRGFREKEVIFFAASLEKGSEHPLAQAILQEANEQGVEIRDVKGFLSVSGKGVEGTVNEDRVLIGNRKFMQENEVDYKDSEDKVLEYERDAKTAIMVAKEGKIIGILAIADKIKEDSKKAIEELAKMGISSVMITGDNKNTAEAIAKKTGISKVVSDVLPEGKVDAIKALQEEYETVVMVGDGINDAPALKQANVGIAIGTGTDVAIEASDITLVRGDLGSLVVAVKLSKGIFRKIKQNYFWAWGYNLLAVPIAMLGLLHPMIGAAAMSLSSLNVVYNSLRLRRENF